jgi:esterase/lipase
MNLLLDGHGGAVSDFSKATMRRWKEQVWEAFSQLRGEHEKVAVVGHSMGALFALQLAIEFPENVSFLLLIGAAIRPWVTLRGIACCTRATFGIAREDHPVEMAIVSAGGIQLTKKLWQYISWAPNMLALLREARYTEKLLSGLKTKSVVFQSVKDEMVSNTSGRLLEKVPFVSLTNLENSTHFYYTEEDVSKIITAFAQLCNGV